MAVPRRSPIGGGSHSAALVLIAAGAACLARSAPARAADVPFEPETVRLFDGKTFSGWVFYSAAKNGKREETWKIETHDNPDEAVLVCLGKPFGYLRTEKEFENFSLSLEWSYVNDPNANSGVLIHTGGMDMIWPQAIQVQLHRPEVGSVFPEGGATTNNVVLTKDVDLPLNQWHRCVVTSRQGTLSVAINDRQPVKVTGCRPRKGWIGLQSEGSEIRFRRIHLHKLK